VITLLEVLAGLSFLERNADIALMIKGCFNQVRLKEKDYALDHLRSQPADDLELSVRALNCIVRFHLLTVGQVESFMTSHTDAELSSGEFRRAYFGKVAKEIRSLLKELGLRSEFGERPDPNEPPFG
jgi:hypothetical protein